MSRHPVYQPMRNVNVLMPEDLIEALNQATLATGRKSCSDMVRVILRDYLITRPAKLANLRAESLQKAAMAAERKRRKARKLPYKCVHIAGTRLDGTIQSNKSVQ